MVDAVLLDKVPQDLLGLPLLSNCAGEVFVEQQGEQLRVAHFQGCSALADIFVALYNQLVQGGLNG